MRSYAKDQILFRKRLLYPTELRDLTANSSRVQRQT
jgi:hypothetical protein